MKNISVIIVSALFVLSIVSIGCNQTSKSKAAEQEITQHIETVKSKIIKYEPVESVLQQADSLSGKTIHVSGIVEHVCKHGGKRFKILSTDGSMELKIELGENFDAVDADMVGAEAKVTGILTPNQMDAEMVKAWERKMMKNHAGEESTEHYKHELSEIQNIYNQILSGEIPFYTEYSVNAEKYELEK